MGNVVSVRCRVCGTVRPAAETPMTPMARLQATLVPTSRKRLCGAILRRDLAMLVRQHGLAPRGVTAAQACGQYTAGGGAARIALQGNLTL